GDNRAQPEIRLHPPHQANPDPEPSFRTPRHQPGSYPVIDPSPSINECEINALPFERRKFWAKHRRQKDSDQFAVSWTESGGPPVAAPARSGFGTAVTRTIIKMSLGANIMLNYPSTGLIW